LSLAIEEQFYLIWPFIIACVGDRKLLWLCAGTVACAFLVRVFMFAAGAQPEMIYMFSICRMDALALGAAAAVVIRRRDVVDVMRRHSTAMILCTLGILFAGAIVSHVYDTHDVLTITVGYTILAIGFAVLVLVAGAGASRRLASIIQRLLSLAALRSVGKYSFAMYVLHLPIELSLDPWLLTAVKPVGAAYPIVYSAIIAVLSYVAAFLSYQLLEKHCLRLKRFLVPHAPSGSAATA
jgi:peptidoglycan/LPS O-acetylase OafA/YrhL